MDVRFNGGKLFNFNGGFVIMKDTIYQNPQILVVKIEQDVIRTSFGGNENELEFSPIE